MAANYGPFFLVVFTVLFIKKAQTLNLTEDKDYDATAHLKLEIVQKYCLHRDDACKSNNTKVCAVRMKEEKKIHKDFQNTCYLFLSNMCDYSGEVTDAVHVTQAATESFDDHRCPYDCPETYNPECLNVNRGEGRNYRVLYFINHCKADDFYCKHSHEFKDQEVMASALSWSLCASSRYVQFSRFVESASSMAHYGWLAGPYKATHIMEPHEQIPGFG